MELEEKDHEQRLNHIFDSFQSERTGKVQESDQEFEPEQEWNYQV